MYRLSRSWCKSQDDKRIGHVWRCPNSLFSQQGKGIRGILLLVLVFLAAIQAVDGIVDVARGSRLGAWLRACCLLLSKSRGGRLVQVVNVIVPEINASDITVELGEDKEKEILGNIPLGLNLSKKSDLAIASQCRSLASGAYKLVKKTSPAPTRTKF
ncbi:hypothetical protein Tco_1337447 [Tanacetum coccineum]